MSARRRFSTLMLAVPGHVLVLATGCQWTHPRAPVGLTPDAEVNVGYGKLERSEVTGAVWSVTVDDLDLQHGGRLDALLRGKVPGLEVFRSSNGDLSLRLRGARSLQATEEPLVVVDGAPIRPGTLDRINTFDVQRIDVLRDVASTSIYGSRGAGGVILITTRRAR